MGVFGDDAIAALPLLAAAFWVPALGAVTITGAVTAISVAVRSRRMKRRRTAAHVPVTSAPAVPPPAVPVPRQVAHPPASSDPPSSDAGREFLLAARRALAIDPAPGSPAATMHDLLGGSTGPGPYAPAKPVAHPAPPAPPRTESASRLGLVEREDPPRVLVRALPDDLAFDMQRIGAQWMLLPDGGAPVELTGDVAIVGRHPLPDARYPGAQLITVRHATVSKTHARIERRGTGWLITDLASTNGVVVVDGDGTDYDATPGSPAHVRERLRLGEMEVRVSR